MGSGTRLVSTFGRTHGLQGYGTNDQHGNRHHLDVNEYLSEH
jgi:hypothetical protein